MFIEPLYDYRTRCLQRSHGITSATTHRASRPAEYDTAPSLACTGNAPAKKSAFVSWVKRMVSSGKMVVRVRFYTVPARLKLPHVALALFVTRGFGSGCMFAVSQRTGRTRSVQRGQGVA